VLAQHKRFRGEQWVVNLVEAKFEHQEDACMYSDEKYWRRITCSTNGALDKLCNECVISATHTTESMDEWLRQSFDEKGVFKEQKVKEEEQEESRCG
jgi:hypothetical protein